MSQSISFRRTVPVLACLDVSKSLAFYQEKLGFQIERQDEAYGVAARDEIEVHLWRCDDSTEFRAVSCRIEVQGINALYDEYRGRKVTHPDGALAEQSWGYKEFSILDCDGNQLTFAEPLAKTANIAIEPMTRKPVVDDAFEVTAEELAFLTTVSPNCGGTRLEIPPPRVSPERRRQRRLTFRNDRNLYQRTCSATQKRIIAVYSPDKNVPIFSQEEWWSDRWDPLSFGRNFDSSRPFFEQFAELRRLVPAKALTNVNCENSDFNNNLHNCKNCYMSFGCLNSEDAYYCSDSNTLRDCIDVWWSKNIELGVGIFNSNTLYDCAFCEDCSESNNLMFCNGCNNCTDCFGCFGLNRKKYCIFNVEYSKEEYEKHTSRFDRGSFQQFQKLQARTKAFYCGHPQRAVKTLFAEDCSGDLVYRSQNCQNCFTVGDCEACRHLYQCGRNKTCHDMDYCYDNSGLVYEALGSYLCFHSAFLVDCHNCSDSYYLIECHSAKNCFACVGLRNCEYCIFNKQYSKANYEALVPKIVAAMKQNNEWGEFFPAEISPFGYNETDASLFYPLSQKEVSSFGWNWCEFEKPEPAAARVIPAAELVDHISQIDESYRDSAVACEVTGALFRFASKELEFYQRHRLPLPRRHPEQRNRDMLALRNPMRLWDRICDKCGTTTATSYPPDEKLSIYCESCYVDEQR